MATTTTHLTIEDFERLPDEAVKNRELVDGELVDVSGNTPLHIDVRDCFIFEFRLWLREHRVGHAFSEQEYDFEGNVHGPDLTFVCREKLHLVNKRKRVQRFVPDLAIEVVSPNDTMENLIRKKDRYRRAGTAEVWLVSPESHEVYVFAASGNRILSMGSTLSSDLLPGFSLTLEDLFRGF